MEPCSSRSPEYDDDGKDLEELLDAFSSVFSLRDIASAYCKAGRNAELAGEILCDLQGSVSNTVSHASNPNSSELSELAGEILCDLQGSVSNTVSHASNAKSSELSFDKISEKSSHANGSSRASKPKRSSVSMGTVSGVLGKGYVRPAPLANESSKATKPLKLDSKDLPVSELWEKQSSSDFAARNDTMHKDVENFMFQMLGDGFQLDMDTIREVLGYCGYNVKESMEKLLDISSLTLAERDEVVGESTETSTGTKPESVSCKEKSQNMNSAESETGVLNRDRTVSPKQDTERENLGKELLAALFSVPERPEVPRRTRPVRMVGRTRAFGQVVVEPPRDTTAEHTAEIVESLEDAEDDEEDSYEVLRRSAKENWVTMKEYYKASADAFAKGDRARSYKLLEQGHFFNKKAREADERSAQKILEIRNKETRDEMPLDLHDHGTKEALRLLKFHLTSISGIKSMPYLKVILETNDEDITKGARKRLILKLLEKESIKWTEEGNAGTILIHVGEINPKRLSFAKKQ